VVSPPVAAAPAAASQTASRGLLGMVIGAVIIWIGFLSVLTARTANPWIVNEIQIERSDAVLLGHWVNRRTGEFAVVKDLLHRQSPGTVTVTGLPERGLPAAESWVIPVTKLGSSYEVTQGHFRYHPIDPVHGVSPQPLEGTIAPQCYPETPDILQQIEQVLQRQPPGPL
jgi:hypothetical protein